jgi:membrane protein implicated in regulation of membrane protease activity
MVAVIESVPVWIWLTTGVLLIMFDAFAASTVYLGCMGASFLAIGLLDAAGLSGLMQVLALPVVFPLLAWQAPRYIKKFMSRRYDSNIDGMLGKTGSVIDLSNQIGDTRAHFAGNGDWQVRTREAGGLNPGDHVRVVGRSGLELIVERIEADSL